MKKLPDTTVEAARKRFITSLVMLVLAVIYLISPIDLIPGPPPFEWIEDIPLLLGALAYSGYSYYSLKRKRAREEDPPRQ
ncbi:MAG: DUF1232 domain-containing protein [Spirochaetes bacterium]|nr:DUF1232 domain-containing protein [Spirochaetota bacterium]